MRGRAVEIEVVLLDVLAVIAFRACQAEGAFLENRITRIPERERETDALLPIADAREPVLIPPVRMRTRVVMRQVIPGGPVLAVVLAHGAPRALAQVRAPALPVHLAVTRFLESAFFSSHGRLLRLELRCGLRASGFQLRARSRRLVRAPIPSAPPGPLPMTQGTRMHQAAMYVLYESPYAKMGGNVSDYEREPIFTPLPGRHSDPLDRHSRTGRADRRLHRDAAAGLRRHMVGRRDDRLDAARVDSAARLPAAGIVHRGGLAGWPQRRTLRVRLAKGRANGDTRRHPADPHGARRGLGGAVGTPAARGGALRCSPSDPIRQTLSFAPEQRARRADLSDAGGATERAGTEHRGGASAGLGVRRRARPTSAARAPSPRSALRARGLRGRGTWAGRLVGSLSAARVAGQGWRTRQPPTTAMHDARHITPRARCAVNDESCGAQPRMPGISRAVSQLKQ